MQRARFRFQKASEGIDVSVLAVDQSRGFILLYVTTELLMFEVGGGRILHLLPLLVGR